MQQKCIRQFFFILMLANASLASADFTLTSWGKTSCVMFSGISYSSGNLLCTQGTSGTTCKGTPAPSGSVVLSSAYVTGHVSGMPSSGTLLRIPFSCSRSGSTLSCDLTGSTTFRYYGSPCTGPSGINGTVTSAGPVTVTLPPDAMDIKYGINSNAICYSTGSPSSVQCRAITVSHGSYYSQAPMSASLAFSEPTTVFTASELDNDGDGINDGVDTDDDNDGVVDDSDNCPRNANPDQADTDADSLPDACTDADDDNDGVADTSDAFPLNAAETVDTDNDGIGNNADADDDNDGLADGNDNCPLASNLDQTDTDGDAQGNACDTDDDNDGVADASDKFPLNAAASSDYDNDGYPGSWNATCDAACQAGSGLLLDNCGTTFNSSQLNTDGDALGDACDSDDDNDGVTDASDAFPLNPAETADSDGDGTGNNADGDDDNDGWLDGSDNCPVNANADQLNTDGDTQGNVCDADDDDDTVPDASDKFPLNVAASVDGDLDGVPTSWNVVCDATCQMNSGLVLDNCPSNANADQLNTDGDAQGDVCDSDDDNDGVVDSGDAFPLDNTQAGDIDGDGVDGYVDNCPANANTDQADTDGDTLPDACTDSDDDNDAVSDTSDEFPLNVAASVDGDLDGVPTSWNAACDATCQMNSGLVLDNCPSNANADQLNTDGDAQGNACDSDDDNDGDSDAQELAQGTDPLDANNSSSLVISFETGVPAGWTKPATANASWVSSNTETMHLAKSLRSGAIGNSQKAQIQFVANIAGTSFSFYLKTSSEAPNDVFRLYVDGVGKVARSGIADWEWVSVVVTPGIHTIKFEYAKNGSVTAGSDAIWIDRLIYVDGTDTDSDGQTDVIDTDDDNDGLPDVMDPLPLQSKFNLNAPYNGSTIRDGIAIP